MESQLKSSKRWLINVSEKEEAIKRLEKSEDFQVISKFNQNIIVESNSSSTIKDLNHLLDDLEIYKINKESNLIKYFK